MLFFYTVCIVQLSYVRVEAQLKLALYNSFHAWSILYIFS